MELKRPVVHTVATKNANRVNNTPKIVKKHEVCSYCGKKDMEYVHHPRSRKGSVLLTATIASSVIAQSILNLFAEAQVNPKHLTINTM